MFKIPDRTADLFGNQAIRDEFEQALKAAGCYHNGQRMYLDGGPFSGAVQIVDQSLRDIDLATLPAADRAFVASVRTLAKHLKWTGYAMTYAREAGDGVKDDWPELLAFVQMQCAAWAQQETHEGPARCVQRIVEPCEQLLQTGNPPADRDDAYAALRQLATRFAGTPGFKRAWALRVG